MIVSSAPLARGHFDFQPPIRGVGRLPADSAAASEGSEGFLPTVRRLPRGGKGASYRKTKGCRRSLVRRATAFNVVIGGLFSRCRHHCHRCRRCHCRHHCHRCRHCHCRHRCCHCHCHCRHHCHRCHRCRHCHCRCQRPKL